MELDVLAREAGWATTDVQEVGSQPDFRVDVRAHGGTAAAGDEPQAPDPRAGRASARGRQGVQRRLTPGGVQLKLDVDAASGVADSGDPEQDLADLLREIGEVAAARRSGRPVSRSTRCTTSMPLRSPRSAWPSRPSAATRSRWRWSAPAFPTFRSV